MTDIFDDTLAAIEAEKTDATRADDLYRKAGERWRAIEAAYDQVRGDAPPTDVLQKAAALLRQYGPKLAARIGGPAAGAAVAGVLADDGAFRGLIGVLGKVVGLLGLGS